MLSENGNLLYVLSNRSLIQMVHYFPSRHKMLFQRSYDVIWTLWTLDERCKNFVCQLGLLLKRE